MFSLTDNSPVSFPPKVNLFLLYYTQTPEIDTKRNVAEE
jgi:hypothetical protein